MKVMEWVYLCSAHPQEQECCAVNYMAHNLDLSTSLINNSKPFKDRSNISNEAVKHLGTIVRRLYRLFSHCYYSHQDIFLSFEEELCLCTRFTKFAKKFDLMSDKLFNIPADVIPR
mmetsp:Transcript_37331/g.33478  ORF Transcript_37331/g.33478 Transcript_37331/m.33478 type:complete len:116 (-) Transcript_37331:127-474(-)